MIFISHTHADKELVEPIANHIASVFGQDKVFYDSWSIQPGDSLIGKMNQGLEDCKFFFFFVSKESLESEMVKLEWQNAIIKRTKREVKFIPVRIDNCPMPTILLETLFINFFTLGPEIATRQIIDVIQGNNTYKSCSTKQFQNIKAYLTKIADKVIIEFRAEAYMEPQSKYLVLLDNKKEELSCKAVGESTFKHGFNEEITLSNGQKFAALSIGRTTATSPGFPFIIKLEPKTNTQINLHGVMRAKSRNEYIQIPLIIEGQSDVA